MRRRLRDERGAVLVMAAVMIPVFLLLTALVVDVGQLVHPQAPAAEPRRRRPRSRPASSTRRTGRRASRPATPRCARRPARAIADAARAVRRRPRGVRLQHRHAAGDAPEHRDREPGEPRRRRQLERPGLHRRHRLHRRRRLAAAGEPVLPAHDRRRHLGAGPLDGRARQGARPPVALRLGRAPALAQRRPGAHRDPPGDQRAPVPAARRAEQRHHARCRCATTTSARGRRTLAKRTSRRSPTRDQGSVAGVRRRSGASRGGTGVGDPQHGRFRVTLPSYGGCGQAYLPDRGRGADREPRRDQLRHELPARSSSRCSTPTASTRLSQIRIWNDGNPGNQIRIGDVRLTGGCGNGRRRVLRDAARRCDRLPLRRGRLRQLGRPDDGDTRTSPPTSPSR